LFFNFVQLAVGFIDMLKAVFFDLDNTLILFDEMKFIGSYFPSVAEKFADVIDPEGFAEKLLKATIELHKNDGTMINRERFLQAFSAGVQLSPDEIWRRFDRFYTEDFDKFKYMVASPNCAHNVFNHIREKGLKIVIATNPIWPLSAQMRRLSWVGLDDVDLALVTHIDNMTFCKPQIGYYQQICSLISEKPGDCLMVGDDPANDMVAARIGIRTYLTDDSLKHAEKPLELSKKVIGNNTEGIPPADFRGPLACVAEAIDTLLA
jgi:FMN phosphatase YigB (HAD superfamily)